MRNNTERPVTVEVGTSEVVGNDPAKIMEAADRILAGGWKKGGIPEGWDGKAGERIVAVLEAYLNA
jgi:UDP-N-acetylglucosamine 2-epimerase (non-hydrolysing)